jgi:ATP-dependent RNA helicase SUPV3L1/SUV3
MFSMNTVRETANPLKTRNVTAVLGPTNTGKTHLAIERMLSHQSGLIGLPLRLLAREVYDKVVARVGADAVALITGEEKIKPENPRFWICTVEAMPRDLAVDFLAVDEIQLAADPERGHVFTERLYHARGTTETLLLGAATMRETIKELMPVANFIARPRLSKLTYAGSKKMSRLPRRSAIVAFSAAEVYEIAEHIRRQHGGAAVVLGAQSPRTRNAQVHLYQAGDVDFIVATDAIGMGLNLDVDHVAFAATRKFDGRQHRDLSLAELGQIAGRAGRHLSDGTFGTTGDTEGFAPEIVEQLEKHEFEPIKVLQWRNGILDFTSLDALRDSLRTMPYHPRLTRARMADDLTALETLAGDSDVRRVAESQEALRKLWDACQVPDYRKVSPANHAELIGQLYGFITKGNGLIPEDWYAEQVAMADRTDGDIDTLSQRLAHIRTWTFVSHRSEWLANFDHWQNRTRDIEHQLSDAMHEQLTQRFVDKRTSVLMRRLRDEEELKAEFGDDGSIKVENHFVGKLTGFRFVPESTAETPEGKAARHAAAQVLNKELAMRARRVAAARSDAFKLNRQGQIEWRGEVLAKLEKSEDQLKPTISILCDEHLSPADREKVQTRLNDWFTEIATERLKPLIELAKAEDVTGLARGIAFRLKENFGVLKRETVASDLRQLDQDARAQLRRFGIRFGAFNIYFPLLLKPAASELMQILWRLSAGERFAAGGAAAFESPRAGLTSVVADKAVPEEFYRVAGYHLCGPRAVRLDMLERLADMIRPLTGFRLNPTNPITPPKGSSGDGGFIVIPEMMSILGCSSDDMTLVLKALGFRSERRPAPPKIVKAAGASQSASAALGETLLVATSDVVPAPLDAEQTVEAVAGLAPDDSDAGLASPVIAEHVPLLEATSIDDVPALELPQAASAVEAQATPQVPEPEPVAARAEPATDIAVAAASSDDDAVEPTPALTADAAIEPEVAPEMVDVWRPKRRQDEGSGDNRRFRGANRGADRSADGKPADGRGNNREGAQGNRRGPRIPPSDQPSADGAAIAATAETVDGASPATVERAAQPSGRYRGDRNRHGSGDRSNAERSTERGAGDRPNADRPQGDRAQGERAAGERANQRGGGDRGRSDRGGSGERRPNDGARRREDNRRPMQMSSGPAPSGSASTTSSGGGQPNKGGNQRDDRRQAYDPNSPFAKLSALKAQLEEQQRNQS